MLVAIRSASLCVISFAEAERRAGLRTEIFAFRVIADITNRGRDVRFCQAILVWLSTENPGECGRLFSPLVALGLHLGGVPSNSSDYRAVAQIVERVWRAHTDQPLRIVGGTTFVNGIVFYFKDQPSMLEYRQSEADALGRRRPHQARRRGYCLSRDGSVLHARAARLRCVLWRRR
jgi:hypothetical protein